MAQIGQFTRTQSGFSGYVRTVTINAELILVPFEPSDAENAPDYRIHLTDEDGPEAGAGWKRNGERAGEYISLLLDDPAFPQPIRANLFRDSDAGNAWSLHWSRPQKRDGKE
ncbi:DUF736 domain-containing protein [Agrobacterium tumefaciens]|uniref:DUF736 domain-containing protein n=1 Tax=Agrobacterium tumefaciens TaxID=358 RepID=UPI00157471B6|nr:DUF736 domain-containing protein [Agrobacterium tumefaciens]UXT20430.1 DUF736 domain-containing protein [Agrobacterium tumefaciens]WHO20778.1 DUF736 domain-containing protein [Agrobacterium tumefaciens]WHO23563.1 DUF736 domain-containing protein [Agrobacterium tumefaciens]